MRDMHHRFSKGIAALSSLLFTLVVVLFGFAVYIEMGLPNVAVLKDIHLQVPLRIYSRDGQLIAEYGAKRRIPVTIAEVPKPLIQAILATEDQRFYSHPGVDFIGLGRAAKAVVGSGQKSQGASTITMQVARNFFLSHKKTYVRKIREILLALKIEHTFSKNKILELYLNKVYFGHRAYGVAAAASVYYGKTLDQLTLAEMAMIAGLPQAPSRNNPLTLPEAAKKRRNHVLQRMLGMKYISQSQYLQAIHEPITASFHSRHVGVYAPYVGEMVREFMVKQYGEEACDKGYSVYTTISAPLQEAAQRALQNGLLDYSERHGFLKEEQHLSRTGGDWQKKWQQELSKRILTDNPLQPAAVLEVGTDRLQALLADGRSIIIPWFGLEWAAPGLKNGKMGSRPQQARDVANFGDVIWVRQSGNEWRLAQVPQVQGALVTLSPQDGSILALTGGFDYQLSEFNRATQAARQPGSSFKPFIYSAALDKGYTLATTLNDAPFVMRDPGQEVLWRPRNDSRTFYGPTRLREGFIKSLNMVSIRILQGIGIKYAVEYAQRFDFNPKQLPHSLSLALGTGLTSPLQMTAGYAVFANGGYQVPPYFIDRIIGQDQKILYSANPPKACWTCISNPSLDANHSPFSAKRVINPQNAYMMNQLLQDVIAHGTAQSALVLKRADIGGKTGTTNTNADAWFVGFNSYLVTAVWVGYDDLHSTHEYGGQAALPIWINFMRQALVGVPERNMLQPPGIVTVRIDPQTGLLAGVDQSNSMFEIFRLGEEPKEETHPSIELPNFEAQDGMQSQEEGEEGDIF